MVPFGSPDLWGGFHLITTGIVALILTVIPERAGDTPSIAGAEGDEPPVSMPEGSV